MKIRQTIEKILKNKIILTALILLVILVIFVLGSYKKDGDSQKEIAGSETKAVSVEKVVKNGHLGASIKIVGKVQPVNSVDVATLVQGKVEGVFFEIGDEVAKNQTLAFLSNSMASTNLSTARASYLSMLNNLDVIRRSADEQIKQAEVGVRNASESVRLAEISLKSAMSNLENSGNIQIKNNEDIRKNSIIAYNDYINFIKTTLDSLNYIIGADDGEQLPGINNSLAVKNTQTLIKAKDDYRLAKTEYSKLSGIKPISESILVSLKDVDAMMFLLNKVATGVVTVLDNTIENQFFSESSLATQKSVYSGLLNSVVAMQSKLQVNINSLEGIGLNDKKLADSLEVAVDSSKSQLEMAKVAYDNALINLERAKQAKEQQIISAQMSIDSSLGQLNLNRDQFSDLTIKAPIAGRISKKSIDVGTEANPGQMIAQISQTDKVKIEINLSSEDAYFVSSGKKAIINDKYEAEVSFISPVADEMTRKVKAEINFDNQDNKLIPGTTVNIEIPADQKTVDEVSSESLFIPIKSVNINQVESYVFVYENGLAKKNPVEIGIQKGAFIEVVSGLLEGNILIVDGSRILEDGDAVEIKE